MFQLYWRSDLRSKFHLPAVWTKHPCWRWIFNLCQSLAGWHWVPRSHPYLQYGRDCPLVSQHWTCPSYDNKLKDASHVWIESWPQQWWESFFFSIPAVLLFFMGHSEDVIEEKHLGKATVLAWKQRGVRHTCFFYPLLDVHCLEFIITLKYHMCLMLYLTHRVIKAPNLHNNKCLWLVEW